MNVNFRVFDLKINLINHQLYLNTGVEFNLHDYGFVNNVTLNPNSPKFSDFKDTTANFSRDKLSTQYLEVPVMLCFNSNPRHKDHNFNIGIGGYYGIMLGAYTKQVSDQRGLQRIYSNFECNPIDYGLIGQIGLGGSQFYFKYNMPSVFDNSKGGPELQSFTVGVKLFNPFGWS